MVVTTSGTTGLRAIFVMDERVLAVTDALRLRALASWLGVADARGARSRSRPYGQS